MIEKALTGPVGILVKFSTLQEHGVDKVFILENDNVDSSQKTVIFLARGEKATAAIAIAGKHPTFLLFAQFLARKEIDSIRRSFVGFPRQKSRRGLKVECVDRIHSTYSVLIPKVMNLKKAQSMACAHLHLAS